MNKALLVFFFCCAVYAVYKLHSISNSLDDIEEMLKRNENAGEKDENKDETKNIE